MKRVAYDIVAIEANKFITKLALSQSYYYWDQYIIYITACGWTDYDFDLETLNRIDNNWDLINRNTDKYKWNLDE